jgi:DNA-binding transcriptional regulator YdaS (Cro superfamily)
MDSLKKIITINGGQNNLVSALKSIRPSSKVQQGHVNNWLRRDLKVPAEWVIACCETVLFEVTPHELRPDIYPHPNDGLPENLRSAE